MSKINYDSIENQKIKGDFVHREVLACFSYEMEAILRASQETSQYKKDYPLPTFEDIENLYEFRCPECGEGYQKEEDAKTCCNTEQEIESEPQEIFEWWIVSEFLYDKLKNLGHPVLEWGNNHYWGRSTTGQAILLDYAISKICEGMEILAGQRYAWNK